MDRIGLISILEQQEHRFGKIFEFRKRFDFIGACLSSS